MKHLFKALIFSVLLIPLLSACGNKGDIRYIAVQMSDKSESWSIVDMSDGNVIADDEFANAPTMMFEDMFFVENDKGLHDFYSVDDVNHTVAEGFKEVTYFKNGRAVVSKEDDDLSIIDKSGQVVAKLSSSIKSAGGFENNYAIVQNEEGKYGYINTEGEIVIKMSYDIAEPFSEDGYAVVGKKDVDAGIIKYEIVNAKGEKLFGFSSEKYKKPLSQFVNGSIAVEGEKEIVYLDENGGKKLKLGDVADGTYGFYAGMTIYADGNIYGIKDEKGEKIIKAKYEKLVPVKNGTFLAVKDGKCIIIDKEGKKLTSDNYDGLTIITEDRFIAKGSNQGYTLIDGQGNEIGQDTYYNVIIGEEPTEMISRGGGKVSSGAGDIDNIKPTGNMDRDVEALVNGASLIFGNINDADAAEKAMADWDKLSRSFNEYYKSEGKDYEFNRAFQTWLEKHPSEGQIINDAYNNAQKMISEAKLAEVKEAVEEAASEVAEEDYDYK